MILCVYSGFVLNRKNQNNGLAKDVVQMKKISALILSGLFLVLHGRSQFGKLSPADSLYWANIKRLTQLDYQNMLGQLHIDSTRPGPSGNPQAANAANTDETKATAYTKLPDPLILNNGARVTTANMWWAQRRPEIVAYFDKDIYDRVPEDMPKITWELVSTIYDTSNHVSAITKKLIGRVDHSSYPAITVNIDLTLCTPAIVNTPVPVIMEFGFVIPPGFTFPAPAPGTKIEEGWQQQLLEKGWGYAIIIPASYQADNGASLT
jgi:hypothetical protein